MRNSTTFHRPKTLQLSRAPKYPRKSIPHQPRLDASKVIIHPLNTESAMKKIEENNTLVFIVDVKANKRQIKESLKKLYDIETIKVNTLIRYVLCSIGFFAGLQLTKKLQSRWHQEGLRPPYPRCRCSRHRCHQAPDRLNDASPIQTPKSWDKGRSFAAVVAGLYHCREKSHLGQIVDSARNSQSTVMKGTKKNQNFSIPASFDEPMKHVCVLLELNCDMTCNLMLLCTLSDHKRLFFISCSGECFQNRDCTMLMRDINAYRASFLIRRRTQSFAPPSGFFRWAAEILHVPLTCHPLLTTLSFLVTCHHNTGFSQKLIVHSHQIELFFASSFFFFRYQSCVVPLPSRWSCAASRAA